MTRESTIALSFRGLHMKSERYSRFDRSVQRISEKLGINVNPLSENRCGFQTNIICNKKSATCRYFSASSFQVLSVIGLFRQNFELPLRGHSRVKWGWLMRLNFSGF